MRQGAGNITDSNASAAPRSGFQKPAGLLNFTAKRVFQRGWKTKEKNGVV
jgi:hypothetical protein